VFISVREGQTQSRRQLTSVKFVSPCHRTRHSSTGDRWIVTSPFHECRSRYSRECMLLREPVHTGFCGGPHAMQHFSMPWSLTQGRPGITCSAQTVAKHLIHPAHHAAGPVAGKQMPSDMPRCRCRTAHGDISTHQVYFVEHDPVSIRYLLQCLIDGPFTALLVIQVPLHVLYIYQRYHTCACACNLQLGAEICATRMGPSSHVMSWYMYAVASHRCVHPTRF
jgi:hypothetical protein